MTIRRSEELHCWQCARELSKFVYELTKKVPFNTEFRHKSQIRSSSGSIMDNIAEGFGRKGNREFANFLHISMGSLCELKSQIYRSFDMDMINENEFTEVLMLLDKTGGKIQNLIFYLEETKIKGAKYKPNQETKKLRN